VQVIERFISADTAAGRFTFVRHEVNQGQMGAFVTGLKHAEGSFIVYVDADDLLLEDFLEAHLSAHTSFEPVAFTSSDQYQINEFGEIIAGTHSDHKAKCHFKYVESRPIHYPYWVWATTSSMMFRRSVLQLILPDNAVPYQICADNYICHFANLIGGSLLVPTVHGCYRRHGKNNFSTNEIIGGDHPTGDMEAHPKHHEIRLNIFSHLCDKSLCFIPAMSKGKFIDALVCTVGPTEILKFYSKLPLKLPLGYILCRSLQLRLAGIFRIIRSRILKLQRDPIAELYGDVEILSLPGE